MCVNAIRWPNNGHNGRSVFESAKKNVKAPKAKVAFIKADNK